MCDECMDRFPRLSGRTWPASFVDSTENKSISSLIGLKDLKTTVAGILETLSKIAPISALNDRAPLHSTPLSTNVHFDTDASDVVNK